MAVSWRRGFFRLWMFGSLLFVGLVAVVSYGPIKSAFHDASLLTDADIGIPPQVPVLCGEARGIEATEFQRQIEATDFQLQTELPKPLFFDTCWYQLPKFRLLYPEYNDLSDQVLASKLYVKMGIPLDATMGIPLAERKSPWTTLLTRVEVAFGVPLIVLILGTALGSGFKAQAEY